MKLFAHLSRSVHQLQDCLHLPRDFPHLAQETASEGVVLAVALVSVAAAAMLVLAQ